MSVYDDCFIAAKGYTLVKQDLKTGKESYWARVKDGKYSLFSRFFLTRRLLRAEITNLYDLPDGSQFCIAKKGIFKRECGSTVFEKCFAVPRGSRPMNLCVDNRGDIYFGEYFANMEKKAVHIYASKDAGKTWQVVYTFEDGNINHIHGLFWDSYTESIWVATGDRENECIIGYTKDGFRTLQTVFRGGQEYRATNLLFYKDYIIFATDSQYIQNTINRIDRTTGEITVVGRMQGSGIYGGQCGDCAFFSATVEPSEVNKDKYAHVWFSRDGLNWEELYKDKKDLWNGMLFQFGSMLFPQYHLKGEMKRLFFSGRAVKKTGGHSVGIDL